MKSDNAEPADFQALDRIAVDMCAVATEKGFHGEPVRPPFLVLTIPHHFGEMCANIHGEVSELWEAYRNSKLASPCDKPCGLTCAEEELADIVIRTMDLAVVMGISLGAAIKAKSDYNRTRPYRHGDKKA